MALQSMSISSKNNIALFLPTFNEEQNIEAVIADIQKHFHGFLFVVDGFSTDNTVKIAQQMNVPVYFRDAHGKGAAIRMALEIAEANNKDFLLFMDCDRTYSPKNIPAMLQDIEGYDLVIGVRELKTIRPYFRRIGNIVATTVINLPLKGKIRDSISGFKCLRVNKFKDLIQENGFVADALICVYALKYGMKIQMVPIDYFERTGESKMGFWVGVRELVKLLKAIWKVL